jgi:hypothetical protein
MTMKELASMNPRQNAAHWTMIGLKKRLPGWTFEVTRGAGVAVDYQGTFRNVLTFSDWKDGEGRRKIRFLNRGVYRNPPPRAAYNSEATLDRIAAFLGAVN